MFEAVKAAFIALPLLIAALVAVSVGAGEEEDRIERETTRLERPCVSGAATENTVGTDGEDVPRRELLDTVTAAEAFLCVDIPEVRNSDGWLATGVNAIRSHALRRFENGAWVDGDDAYKYAETYYANEDLEAFVSLIVQPEDYEERTGVGILCEPDDTVATREVDVTIADSDATLWVVLEPQSVQPGATVCWQRDGLFFYAGVSFQPGFDVEAEVLPLLRAVE